MSKHPSPAPARPASAPAGGGRSGAVDVLKAVAVIGVLLIHSAASGFNTAMGSFDWYAALFWGILPRASVPIFFMVSGALMLDPRREFSLKKLWTRSIPRLFIAMMFWAFCYRLYHLLGSGFYLGGLVDALKHTLSFHHEFHLYYMHIILLVYALLPLTRLITAHADKRTLEYLLAVWFVLGILLPAVMDIWPFTLLFGIPAQYPLTLTYSSFGYTLLGWYLKEYARSWKNFAVTGLAGFCMVYAGTAIPSLRAGAMVTAALEATTPGVMLLGTGIFGVIFAAMRGKAAPRICRTLAKASFCIYLTHIFFLYILGGLGLNATAGPCVLFIPLTTAAALLCSLAVWLVCSRIPVVRDWLI